MAVLEKRKFDSIMFGQLPARPLHLSVRPIAVNEFFLGGNALLRQLEMELDFGDKLAVIPLTAVIPKGTSPCPAIILINEENSVDSPKVKKWIDNGYAVFSLYYKDISENNGNFKSGISAYIAPTRRKKSSASKVAVWAWAAIRALEYAADIDEIDENKIGVAGEGVFALSAHLAITVEEKFSFVFPEDVPEICDNMKQSHPYLFSPEYLK